MTNTAVLASHAHPLKFSTDLKMLSPPSLFFSDKQTSWAASVFVTSSRYYCTGPLRTATAFDATHTILLASNRNNRPAIPRRVPCLRVWLIKLLALPKRKERQPVTATAAAVLWLAPSQNQLTLDRSRRGTTRNSHSYTAMTQSLRHLKSSSRRHHSPQAPWPRRMARALII